MREKLEDVVDLLGETTRQHLISLVEDEHLHAVGAEHATLDHVLDTAGRADHDLRTILQSLHIIAHAGSTNAGVALNAHKVTDSDDDLLNLLGEFTGGSKDERLAGLEVGVDLLENGNGEGGGLASAGLRLGNDIATCRR